MTISSNSRFYNPLEILRVNENHIFSTSISKIHISETFSGFKAARCVTAITLPKTLMDRKSHFSCYCISYMVILGKKNICFSNSNIIFQNSLNKNLYFKKLIHAYIETVHHATILFIYIFATYIKISLQLVIDQVLPNYCSAAHSRLAQNTNLWCLIYYQL